MRDSKQPNKLLNSNNGEEAKADDMYDIGTTANPAQSLHIMKDDISNPPDQIEIEDDDYSEDYEEDEINH